MEKVGKWGWSRFFFWAPDFWLGMFGSESGARNREPGIGGTESVTRNREHEKVGKWRSFFSFFGNPDREPGSGTRIPNTDSEPGFRTRIGNTDREVGIGSSGRVRSRSVAPVGDATCF